MNNCIKLDPNFKRSFIGEIIKVCNGVEQKSFIAQCKDFLVVAVLLCLLEVILVFVLCSLL